MRKIAGTILEFLHCLLYVVIICILFFSNDFNIILFISALNFHVIFYWYFINKCILNDIKMSLKDDKCKSISTKDREYYLVDIIYSRIVIYKDVCESYWTYLIYFFFIFSIFKLYIIYNKRK